MGTHLYRLRPPMVTRLEKTLKLCICLGQDWMFRYPGGRGGGQGGLGGGPSIPQPRCSPVISRTVRKTFSFSGSSAEMLRQGSLWSQSHQLGQWGGCTPPPPDPPGPHPSRPVMRKSRLPKILVQFTKVSMLLESTVWYLLPAPVPSQAVGRGW